MSDDRTSIRACAGSTAAARLADEIAAALARGDAGQALGARPVAVDGCAYACTRRSLEARGLRPLAVSLDQLAVEPDEEVSGGELSSLRVEAVRRLDAQAALSTRPRGRRRRDRRPGVRSPAGRAHTGDDYLFAVHLLTSPVAVCGAVVADTPTVAAHVASALSVSRASAGEMLARLESAGLVVRGPAREILLTEAGREAAEQVVRRHRVVERFLVDVLDYTPAESYRLALETRDSFPEVVAARLETVTAGSADCPHGWPIDPSADPGFARDLVALSTLPEGAAGRVAALLEHDADVLERLFAQGLTPGVRVTVTAGNGNPAVEIDGAPRRVGDDASAVLVARL